MAYKIDRLYVVAGPRSCGKSTFLENSAARIDAKSLPVPLQRIVADPPKLIEAYQMESHKGRQLGDIRLHVDLITPLDFVKGFSIENYDKFITNKMYTNWKALECIHYAKEVHFLTLFLSRQELFRRWLTRVIKSGEHHVRKNVVTIYGDSTDDAAPLRTLYQAWSDFVETFQHHGHSSLDVRESSYRYHPVFSPDLITDK
ncbi:MAG: hypothetical protein V4727_04325 [Verrucomicrobiota bacterium]